MGAVEMRHKPSKQPARNSKAAVSPAVPAAEPWKSLLWVRVAGKARTSVMAVCCVGKRDQPFSSASLSSYSSITKPVPGALPGTSVLPYSCLQSILHQEKLAQATLPVTES